MNAQKVLTDKQIHRRQTIAIWLIGVGFILDAISIVFWSIAFLLLYKLADSPGKIFLRRWILGGLMAILQLGIIAIMSNIWDLVPPYGTIINAGVNMGITIYMISGLCVLAENHPVWKPELGYIALALLFFSFAIMFLFPVLGSIKIVLAIGAIIAMRKLLRSEIFDPNCGNRVDNVASTFWVPGVIGAIVCFGIIWFYSFIINI